MKRFVKSEAWTCPDEDWDNEASLQAFPEMVNGISPDLGKRTGLVVIRILRKAFRDKEEYSVDPPPYEMWQAASRGVYQMYQSRMAERHADRVAAKHGLR